MFNEEFKIKFITSVTESEAVRKYFRSLFNSSESFEVGLQKDLSEFDSDEMQKFCDHSSGIRKSSKVTFMAHIKKYLDFSRSSGMNVVCDISDIKLDGVAKMRDKMVFSADHLNRYMDAVFGKVDDETVGVVYRCFLWMAFLDIEPRDAISVSVNDVFISKKIVFVFDKPIIIPDEAVIAFEKARDLCEFRIFNPHAGDKVIYKKRMSGDGLFRLSQRNEVRDSSGREPFEPILGSINRAAKNAIDNGVVRAKLAYKSVRLSGVFCRAYEREEMGLKTDFSKLVENAVTNHFGNSINNVPQKIVGNYRVKMLDDYTSNFNAWKLARLMYLRDSYL